MAKNNIDVQFSKNKANACFDNISGVGIVYKMIYYESKDKFPKYGKKNIIYIDKSDNYKMYLWNVETQEYVSAIGSGVVTGVKGDNEATYRTGNVNISPDNIGLGNVDNTSDMDKPVSRAQAEAIASAVESYIFNQSFASDTWTINHNLDRYPSVSVVDSANNIVVGECKYIDKNNLVITFNSAFSGKVYLN